MSPGSNFKYIPTLTRELKESPNSFYFNYLLNQFMATGRSRDFDGSQTWLTVCLSREQEHPASVLATEALAKAYFGRLQGYQDVVNNGSRTYSQALLALCENLKDPQKSLSYDTLAASAVLTFYEYLVFTTKQGWVMHSQGVARLIEMRGPERFLEFPYRAILNTHRQILIIQALASRKRTFLEQARWIEVAWPEPTGRPPIVRVHDIFARLPGMTEDILRMEDDPSVSAGFVLVTQRKIDKIVDELRVLELDMLVDDSRMAEEESTSAASPTNPFATEVKYPSLVAASLWTSFDAIMILALEWQYKSRHPEWQKGTNHEGCELVPETRQYALHICKSVEYLLQPQWMHSGAFYLIFPTRVAFMALPVASPEALWIVGILERMATASGFEMARNVLTNVQINEKEEGGMNGAKASHAPSLLASSHGA
jgi:Fungal specific transcription factor domain